MNIAEISKLINLVRKLELTITSDDGTWLDHLNASQAFLTCIGAGPWKIQRRSLIQKGAVSALKDKDLSQIEDVRIFGFPLDWQNEKTALMIDHLKTHNTEMAPFSASLSSVADPRKTLYEITQTKGRAKVLDLFIRDYLKLSSFPIDRHVERLLKDNNFPVNENYMTTLCKEAGLDACHVARLFLSASGKFSGNGEIKVF